MGAISPTFCGTRFGVLRLANPANFATVPAVVPSVATGG